MPRQPRLLSESGIYHVMLRGVNRDVIFLEEGDRHRFLAALMATKEASGCAVLAYCLMQNHVHLILQTVDEPIGATVKRLAVRYAGWFNRTYGRDGHFFQDRFRSVPVEDDIYFVALVRYVWCNPVVAGLVADPVDYPWNSCSPQSPPGLADATILSRPCRRGQRRSCQPRCLRVAPPRGSVVVPVATHTVRRRSC